MDNVIDMTEIHDALSHLIGSLSQDPELKHLKPLAENAEERCDSLLVDIQRNFLRGETSTSRVSC